MKSSLFVLLVLLVPFAAAAETWQRAELTFTAKESVKSPQDVALTVTVRRGSENISVAAFWDGGQTWKARVRITGDGWTYQTASVPVVAGLDNQQGPIAAAQCTSLHPRFAVHGPVQMSDNKRYLVQADKTPFFWLGDTVWTGPALSTVADWKEFLADRVSKHFTVIQFNMVSPWRAAKTDLEGRTAYTGSNPIKINPDYYRRVDDRLNMINAAGLVGAPILIWGNKVGDAGIDLQDDDALKLVKYELARYGAHDVVWILAGDNTYKDAQGERWRKIGRQLFAGTKHAPTISHPTGMNWPWDAWREETWLDVAGYQSGHGDSTNTLNWIHSGPPAQKWQAEPVRAFINLEPPYEGHWAYQSKKPHSDYNVRRACYWSLLNTPTAGVTYGGHGIWSWQTEPNKTPPDHPGTGIAKVWREAKDLPGAGQMRHLIDLFQSVPWWRLTPANDLLVAQSFGDDPAKHVSVAKTDNNDALIAYLPVGGEIELKDLKWAAGVQPHWFDPRTGRRQPAPATGHKYKAPDEQDWLLVFAVPTP